MTFDILNTLSNFEVFYELIIFFIFTLTTGSLIYKYRDEIVKKTKNIRNLFDFSRLYEKPISFTLIIYITLLSVMFSKFINFLSLDANSILVVITALYVIFTYEIVNQGFRNQKIQLNNQKIDFLERRLEFLYHPLEHELKNTHNNNQIVSILENFHKYLYLSSIQLNTSISEYQKKTVSVATIKCEERSSLEAQYRKEILEIIGKDIKLFKDELHSMLNEKT